MKTLVTFRNDNGTYDDVGTTNRTFRHDLKTIMSITRWARNISNGKTYKLQIWNDFDWYKPNSKPFYERIFNGVS